MPGLSLSIIAWEMTLPCWIEIRCTPGNLKVEQPWTSKIVESIRTAFIVLFMGTSLSNVMITLNN